MPVDFSISLLELSILSFHLCLQPFSLCLQPLSLCLTTSEYMEPLYRIVGNFRGVQILWKGNLQRFRGLIFVDGHSRTALPTIPGWLRLLLRRATWIRKLGSIARRLKIAQQRHSCRSSTTNWCEVIDRAACRSRWPCPLLIARENFISQV